MAKRTPKKKQAPKVMRTTMASRKETVRRCPVCKGNPTTEEMKNKLGFNSIKYCVEVIDGEHCMEVTDYTK